MNLDELEAKVTLMEDIQEIENLQKIYGYYFEMQMLEEIVDLFSDNAESVEITDHGLFRGKTGVKKNVPGMDGRRSAAASSSTFTSASNGGYCQNLSTPGCC